MNKHPKIPAHYQTVMPYLIIPNASAFSDFMQKVFNASEPYKAMRDENTIMHAEVIVDDCTIMFADATEKYKARPAGMFIYVDDSDETYRKALEAGATALSEMTDQPYGRSGGVLDPFGNSWWITSPLTSNS